MPFPKTTPFLLALTACDGGDDSTGAPNNSLPAGCDTDICSKYVGAMPIVIKEIVAQASTDPQFEDDFAPLVARGKEAVGAFEQSLANFLAHVYGCPDAPPYDGPSMEEAHAGMAITQQEYDDFVAIIAGVLADNGVPNETIDTCFAPPLQDAEFAGTIIGQ
jgi:truncated hemoglobin YjbI